MEVRREISSYLITFLMIFLSGSCLCISAFGPARHAHGGSSHFLLRRSHSSDPHHHRGPQQGHTAPHEGAKEGEAVVHFPEDGAVMEDDGFTKVVYDEDDYIPDDGDEYYDFDARPEKDFVHPQNNEKPGVFPKKFQVSDEKKKQPFSHKENLKITSKGPEVIVKEKGVLLDATNDPPFTSPDEVDEDIWRREPMVLPVTTEGKTKQKTEDPLKVYGFPKELMPIMPGGGSRFEDVEREKLEKKKMSQTKGSDDDSAENAGSHEAEGLYSSASFSSLSLCFYWLMSFHRIDRILLL